MSEIKQIEAIIIDCDGTLTSGGVTYSESGERQKTFHSRDIPAIKKLVGFGFRVMIVSQSKWQGVKYFADRCGCEYYTGVADKLEFVQKKGIDPGKCIVFTDSMDDNGIVCESYVAYVPKDGNFHALSNARTLDVNGGCGVIDYFLTQCLVRHESWGGVNRMVLIFNGDEITPAAVAKNPEPDPHDFCANAATAKTCKSTADQLAQRAKQEVHVLKNLAVLGGDETADKKAGRIYDLIDQIVVCGVSEKRYGNSCIIEPNAQPLDLAVLTEIAQLRKENQELKDKAEKQNEILYNTSNKVKSLKAKIYDIQNKEK